MAISQRLQKTINRGAAGYHNCDNIEQVEAIFEALDQDRPDVAQSLALVAIISRLDDIENAVRYASPPAGD